ncbi:BhlA/UviB family holin-like peptide, partial [Intestinibacter bartlettii]
QEKREENYQKMIFELTEELKIISEINDHVKNIIPKKLI